MLSRVCLPVDVGNDALGAPLEQPLRDRPADAHGRPGHDAALPAKIHPYSHSQYETIVVMSLSLRSPMTLKTGKTGISFWVRPRIGGRSNTLQGWAKIVGPRLRELAPSGENQEAGFTQPWVHSLAHPCRQISLTLVCVVILFVMDLFNASFHEDLLCLPYVSDEQPGGFGWSG